MENDLIQTEFWDFTHMDGEKPLQRYTNQITNSRGNLFAGMWDSAAFTSELQSFPYNEFVQLLEGEVTIVEQNGTKNWFKSNDAFFIPEGTECQWIVSGYVKMYYCVVGPASNLASFSKTD